MRLLFFHVSLWIAAQWVAQWLGLSTLATVNASSASCSDTRRLQSINEPPLDTLYDVCVVADSHLFLVIQPSNDESQESFSYNSCYDPIALTSFPQFLSLSDESDVSARVNDLRPPTQCVVTEVQYGQIRDALQLSAEEWPGQYDLVIRNCAVRILRVLRLLGYTEISDDLKAYLGTQLTANGVGDLARSDPVVIDRLYGDTEADLDTFVMSLTNEIVVNDLITRTIAQAGSCGDLSIDNILEECDEGEDNGKEDGTCSSFCSFAFAWYCPTGFELGDVQMSCVPTDDGGCDEECLRTNCEQGSEYSGPGTFDPATSTCSFMRCPWRVGSVQTSETECVNGEPVEQCNGDCQFARCLRGGGNPVLELDEDWDDCLASQTPIDTCFIQVVARQTPPHICTNTPCKQNTFFAYETGETGTELDTCFGSDRPQCGAWCHRQICLDSGGVFPDLDFSVNSYTCIYPAIDLKCKLETNEEDCEAQQNGCHWCEEGNFCRNDLIACPLEDADADDECICDDVALDVEAFRDPTDNSFSYTVKFDWDENCDFLATINSIEVGDVGYITSLSTEVDIDGNAGETTITLEVSPLDDTSDYELLKIGFGEGDCTVVWPLDTRMSVKPARMPKMRGKKNGDDDYDDDLDGKKGRPLL